VVCSVDTMETILASDALLSMYSFVHPAAAGAVGISVRRGTAGRGVAAGAYTRPLFSST